jgi:hypothetical protein
MIKSSCPLSFETIVVAILEYWRQAGPDHAMPIIILVLFLFCFESFRFRNEGRYFRHSRYGRSAKRGSCLVQASGRLNLINENVV